MFFIDKRYILYDNQFMNIQNTLDYMNKNHADRGWAVLAERVPQSEDAPHKIAVVKDSIKSNEPVVLVLPGTGGGIVECNGLLKRVHDFVKNNDATKQARVCIAIYDYQEQYIKNLSRAALIVNKRYPVLWFMLKHISRHPWTRTDSNTRNPAAIYDIYNSAIKPKLVDDSGNRLPTQQMLKNIRTVTIVGYCAGGHVAMLLEEIIKKEMAPYGYNATEIKSALEQVAVIGYAMDAPYEKSDLKFFGFNSVSDKREFDSIFKDYLYFFEHSMTFDLMHFSKKHSDTFYCQSLRKKQQTQDGKNIIIVHNAEDLFKQREEAAKIELHTDHIESKTDSYSPHSFIGFVEKNGFSNGAKQLQSMFKSIIAKSIENSIQNSENPDFIPLPETLDLIGENVDAYGKSNVVYSQQNLIYQFYRPTAYLLNIPKIHWCIKSGRLHQPKNK